MHLCIYAFIEVHVYLPTKDKNAQIMINSMACDEQYL